MTANEIRSKFLNFFEQRDHKIVPSAPLPLRNDPTLMFTNAGMNQFKEIFIASQLPEHVRLANSQKCLRVAGKHNDLEEVGFDGYHHTFFEMLGNWSFGDYFKAGAIELAWSLLTTVYNLPPKRLYVTYFGGDQLLPADVETRDLWLEHVAQENILVGSAKDNFWQMGTTGPCGPCSEIHIDLRSDSERKNTPGSALVNKDHPKVIELWNLVFMQYNRRVDQSLSLLPAQHVDTGMGLERLCMVFQNKQSSYDTDLFSPLIEVLQSRSGRIYTNDKAWSSVAMRVVADHARALTMAIADNELPSNTAQGYVLRRMLRRASRYAYSHLGLKEPAIHTLVPTIAEQFSGILPRIQANAQFIQATICSEEESFLRNLEVGMRRLSSYLEGHSSISGDFAFELYDTFGFPIDLTTTIAKERHINVDLSGFDECLSVQKQRSKHAGTLFYEDWEEVNPGLGSAFLGYKNHSLEAKVIKYRRATLKGKSCVQLVLDQTPFYPEGGGQVGDMGWLCTSQDPSKKYPVINTVKENGLILHVLETLPPDLTSMYLAQVDVDRREAISANHSATHLLGFALEQILGQQIQQKGSYVSDAYLRFDFAYPTKLTTQDLQKVEKLVNLLIKRALPLKDMRDIPFKQAVEMGAKAWFTDKYADLVRVIQFGESIELCGGTHIGSTAQIGLFKIISEKAVASGVRRIEALTSDRAADFFQSALSELQEVRRILKTNAAVQPVIEKLMAENKALSRELKKLSEERLNRMLARLAENATDLNGLKTALGGFELEIKDFTKLVVRFMATYKNVLVLAANQHQGKTYLLLASNALQKFPDLSSVVALLLKQHETLTQLSQTPNYVLLSSSKSIDMHELQELLAVILRRAQGYTAEDDA